MREAVIDNEFGKVELESKGPLVFVHAEIRKWSKNLYKEYREVWDELLLELHDRGIKELYCLCPQGDHKIFKFQNKFGFVQRMGVRSDEGKEYILMSQAI